MAVTTTRAITMKAEKKWEFLNYALIWPTHEENQDTFNSPPFHAEGDESVKWSLRFRPYGRKGDDGKDTSLALVLQQSSESRAKINAKFTLTIRHEEKNETLSHHTDGMLSHVFIRGSLIGYGYLSFSRKTEILNCNALSIICKLEYAHTTTTTSNVHHTLSLPTNEKEDSSLTKDLGQLLSTNEGSNICFVINGQEIKAHKLIISARSPVFAAMFTSGMKENLVNRVDIEDVSPDVFQALLHFIYTDQVDFAEVDAKDLLIAANKYLLPLLKFQCQESLSQSLTKENCTEMLMLADVHNAVYLKKSATRLIRVHHKEIMKTDNWKNLKESSPELAVHVFEGLI